MKSEGIFEAEYKKLNKAQGEAVEALEGPVMVVAGPGTGKTQILALRIANILKKTDIKADGILCLTFTNSAVDAMRDRLVRYIGEAGEKVNIFTFHSFGQKIIEKYFSVLGLEQAPRLLEETEAVIFFDEILNSHDWEYLRPRADSARYFKDLKSLISLLKRERISRKEFASAIDAEIEAVKRSEDSISSRGESKGDLKKDVLARIENLEKTREVAKFLEVYDAAKQEKNMIDYDDILEGLVRIAEESPEALADIREKYLYVLVDEHQDSSRVQNEFLARVWSGLESPDIFVVGDDRQLIYGFSGASIDHFKGFKKTFPGAKLVPLVENYRSTQIILDAAHALLTSVMSDEKLVSQSQEHYPISLVEAPDPEEEILSAVADLKEKVKQGVKAEDCAILVPKNAQARRAMEILHREDIPVAVSDSFNFFGQKEGEAMLRILKIINSGDAPSLALSFFDEVSGIAPLEAHEFIAKQRMREFSFASAGSVPGSLFEEGPVEKWLAKLNKWKKDADSGDLASLIQTIGKEMPDKAIVSGEDLARTLLSLLEKRPDMLLHELVAELDKAREYGGELRLVASPKEGVRVLTMHSSKGQEFEWVWIAHMDERSLSGGRRMSFSLPESVSEKIEERDIDAIKRKLYVAITRAKRFCTLSYAVSSLKGRGQELSKIIAELPEEVFERNTAKVKNDKKPERRDLSELLKLVSEKYTERYVSASLLNNFFECPWKWYFENLLQMPKPPIEVLEFGSAIHAALEQVLNGGILPEDKGIRKILEPWVKNRLPEITSSRKTEESVSVKDERFPHLKIYGKVDLIENLSGKEVRVTDFKTGSAKKKYEIEKLDVEGRMSNLLRQLSMYAYLLSENPKWRADVREVRLEFLEAKNPKESIYDRAIKREEIEMLKADIIDYDKAIKSGEWTERECRYNSYGKNTECEYCKQAEVFR